MRQVDVIAAEDTRHTRKLLDEYQIEATLTSYFDHNKSRKADQIIEWMKAGKQVALVSDAGTPGISDPGYRLINLAMEHDIPVDVIPGPTAVVAALSLSGLPSDAFIFEGFLPVKSMGRQKKLAEYKQEKRTVIFYESPHRILKSLEDIVAALGDPHIVVIRELTKKFQEMQSGVASDLLKHFTAHKPRGEFVVLFNMRMQS